MPLPKLTRRSALLGLTAAWSLGGMSLAFAGAATEKRLVVVILRGALDGMAAVVPYGDAHLATWRPGLIPPAPGQPGGLLDLGGFYGLHPALTGMHSLFQAGELAPVHAVAGSYRVRSHFEAQDYMESGAEQRMTSGWLNRAVGQMSGAPPAGLAMSVGLSVPLLLRGYATVANWAPQGFAQPEPDLYARLAALHASDPLTGPAIREGLDERGFSHAVLSGQEAPKNRYSAAALAEAAGRMLAAPNGPRIAALELGGWDTHAAQMQRLTAPLTELDAGLAALKTGLGPAWAQTAVLVMTEFGRTVRMNGTNGTDHGTATTAFLAGGAIHGGRVLGTWPGLAESQLFENRDLAPTTDLRSLAKGLLQDHLNLTPTALATTFPDSSPASPSHGLLRA